MVSALAVTACAPVDGSEENVGQVSQAVSNLGNEHDLVLNEFPTRNLSTTWLPSLDVHGPILAAYTVGGPEAPGAWYAYTEGAGGPDPLNWQPGAAGGYIGAQFRWDDMAHPWPQPENFCEHYTCTGMNIDTFVEYTASVKALSTDFLGVATIVAISRTNDSGNDAYDVVVLTSLDDGATFTNARIVSTGSSGGSALEWLHRVDATTIVTTEEGSERDRESTAAHVVVWFGGPSGDERWWVSKVLVDPETGRVATLNAPMELEIFDFETTGTSRVTVAAYEDLDGLENIAFFSSRRRDQDGNPYGPYDPLPACPTTERLNIEWRYNRAVGLFDHNPSVNPNWVANVIIDDDPAWKPCVGPGSDFYANGERGDMAFNRHPWLAKFAYAKTEPESDLVRVYMVERGLAGLGYVGSPSPSGTTRTQILEAGEDDEDYNPKIEMGQGMDSTSPSSRDNPRFALVRKRVDRNGDVSVIGRTENWFIWFGSPLNPGGYATDETVDEAQITAPTAPSVVEGTTLGLTHQPICFSDAYGTCFNLQPERLFHALYPRSRFDTIVGRAFED